MPICTPPLVRTLRPRSARLGAGIALLAAALVPGCTTYYKVTDPTTKQAYYSTDVDSDKYKSGAVRFTDAATGATVTLQSSEVQTIDKQQFESAVKKK